MKKTDYTGPLTLSPSQVLVGAACCVTKCTLCIFTKGNVNTAQSRHDSAPSLLDPSGERGSSAKCHVWLGHCPSCMFTVQICISKLLEFQSDSESQILPLKICIHCF